ncbi:MAG TPA: MazG nucleotide pyrophosphohydrolase domain-containing protein [Candidatus Saccharimonadales bacterium]|nr:MazG nucleotide pyrophosphohydrolase domain-containing protein [Candidatus Saccharimonadales bacterium]
MDQKEVFNSIRQERLRQDIKHSSNRVNDMLPILIEEVGEVGTAIQYQDQDNLKEELIHTAAVCVRWLEML